MAIVNFHSEIESVNKKKGNKKKEIKEPKKEIAKAKKEKKEPKTRRKNKEERKEKYISCRVNYKDYELIKKLLETKNLKVYDLIDYAIHSISEKDKNELNRQIIRIGTNVNQITRHYNITNELPEVKALKEIQKELKKIQFLIMEK